MIRNGAKIDVEQYRVASVGVGCCCISVFNNNDTTIVDYQWRHQLWGTGARAPLTLASLWITPNLSNYMHKQYPGMFSPIKQRGQLGGTYFLTAGSLEVICDWL